jgi:hypothetical protein
LIVAKDTYKGSIISYHFITTESLCEYQTILKEITDKEFIIKAAVIDGKRGLFRLLAGVPIQMCHFHQQAIITRYLTRKPKLKASIDLKRISSYLGKVEQKRFELLLEYWYKKYEVFIKEKTYNAQTEKWHYTHRRLRSAYRSLKETVQTFVSSNR